MSYRQISSKSRSDSLDPRSLEDKKAMAIEFVGQQMTKYPIPGMALSVVDQDETVLAHGFGTKKFGQTDAPVTSDTLFQIGSFTKSFIALSVATLVDQEKMQWHDPVKQHLPSFTLMDKYAEEHTTVADLLSMNSVFGTYQGDYAWAVGVYPTERTLVEHLAKFKTTRTFRAGWSYSNINYIVVGQVIEAVSHQPWEKYLRDAILAPLGMDHTVAQAIDAEPERLSAGHLYCDHNVAGPYDVLKDRHVAVVPQNGLMAAGSIISSAADISKFSTLLLQHGRGIVKNRAVFEAMVTGQQVVSVTGPEMESIGYYDFEPSRRVVGSGYGFDIVGNVAFGLDCYSKNGGTAGFLTESVFVPSRGLGVVLLSNACPQDGDPASKIAMAQMRAYILGIFLEIPKDTLDMLHQKAIDNVRVTTEHIPCDTHCFGGEPWAKPGVEISEATKQALVGTYSASTNEFMGTATIFTRGNELMMQYGAYTTPLLPTDDSNVVVWNIDMLLAPVTILGPGRISMFYEEYARLETN
ncbi:Aste57867_2599 [Aphanomyces stellatus]|uniref:Aste57867_2599 protein n=1 Tax=Aphanomyces stellatus TaxID=120398 RepID=A0A485K9J6_9STRA|nr:hypothetical protein As57867_002592 [Aphanomyces stellatus]VFT79795.1 Aste57867_2599 [Aphanomyces stellatus]